VQGEIIGSKIQGNKYNRDGNEFYVFNVYQYDQGRRVSFRQEQQVLFCDKLGLNTVPRLKYNESIGTSIPELVENAKGKSVLADVIREGVVYRNYEHNISFKVINPDFLLKYSE
jgi:ATP-dependent RNA circularization protein (DNA/RNA ligase family)